jgi:NAD(P)-dependent dehydrogenase (short-subunit alcohol dehydrogenase family)
MDLGLNGRVIVVTAAGSGIGRACAEIFVREGAHAVAGDLAIDGMQGISGPGSLTPVALDLADPAGPGKLVQVALDRHGVVDGLVNVLGGAAVRESFITTDDDAWAVMFNRNVMAMVRACRAALPGMVERKRGAVVNIASTSGRQPDPFMVDYSAAKSCVLSITKSISIEFGPMGIRANSVSPGVTRTPAVMRSIGTVMAAKWGKTTEEALAYHVSEYHRVPLQRLGNPEDVAAVAAFLVSDVAAQVTGSEYVVDGGLLKAH